MVEVASRSIEPIARERVKECLIEAHAFRRRLALLSKTNWITIVAPALLSAIAGAAIFEVSEASVLGAQWKVWTGGAALLSALLVAVHKGRNCDFYQAECRRLVQEFEGLATRYRTLLQLDVEEPRQRLEELELRLAMVRETAAIDYPASYRADAEKSVDAALGAAVA